MCIRLQRDRSAGIYAGQFLWPGAFLRNAVVFMRTFVSTSCFQAKKERERELVTEFIFNRDILQFEIMIRK